MSTILEEQSLGQTGLVFDKDIVEIGNIAGADEGILINVITFGQKGVKPKEELKEEKKDTKNDLTNKSFLNELCSQSPFLIILPISSIPFV